MTTFYTRFFLTMFVISYFALMVDCINTHAKLKEVKNGMCTGFVARPIKPMVEHIAPPVKQIKAVKLASFNPQDAALASYLPKLPIKSLSISK
jgi:hypothetical protein